MPLDECRDCEERFPGGEGLVDGRCPRCLAVYRERQEEQEPEGQGEPAPQEEN
jgi:hypothetical protein